MCQLSRRKSGVLGYSRLRDGDMVAEGRTYMHVVDFCTCGYDSVSKTLN